MSKNKPGKKGVGFVNLQKARTEKNKPKADGDFSGMKMVETNKFKKVNRYDFFHQLRSLLNHFSDYVCMSSAFHTVIAYPRRNFYFIVLCDI